MSHRSGSRTGCDDGGARLRINATKSVAWGGEYERDTTAAVADASGDSALTAEDLNRAIG